MADHPEPELLEQLVVEFRDHGRRAVEFLQTARDLVEAGLDRSPRSAEMVAYCLREALKAIPASQDRGDGSEWRRLSRRVVDARHRYRIASEGLPGQDAEAELAGLLRSIDDLDEFHNSEGLHQRRLIAVIVDRTGAIPYESGNQLIRVYQEVLERLDRGVHGTLDTAAATDLYNEAVGLLRRLFTPPEARNAELAALAGVPAPTEDDLERLQQLVVTPQHLQHFLAQLTSPAWLTVLAETTFVDPPAGRGSWPGFAITDSLIPTHADEVIAWLTKLYDRCGTDPARAWYLARAASDAGPSAHSLIIRALHDHAGSRDVRTIGYSLLSSTDPTDPVVEDLADVVLNPTEDAASMLDHIARRLVDGITAHNAISRLQLIGYKLRSVDQSQHGWHWFVMNPSGSIASHDRGRPNDQFDVLLRAFVAAAEVARPLHETEPVMRVADSLPAEIRGRARAWLLGIDPMSRSPTLSPKSRPPSQRETRPAMTYRYSTGWSRAVRRSSTSPNGPRPWDPLPLLTKSGGRSGSTNRINGGCGHIGGWVWYPNRSTGRGPTCTC